MAKETKLKATSEELKLRKLLINLRELKGECRTTFCYDILAYLEYEAELSTCKIDAFFIKAVRKKFGEFNIEADIVLMALGLLDGCDYNVSLQIKGRREIFLRESTYLKQDKSSYDKATDDDKKKYIDNLRNSEDNELLLLSKFLIKNKDKMKEFLNDIDDFIDDGIAIFPTPSYLKRKPLQDRIRQAIVKFFLLGKRLFAIKSDIAINKNDEYEININLTKEAIAILSNATICMLLCISIPITTTIYTQKYTIVETQETDMEYQTKNDITKTYERANQKLDAKPTTDLSSENDAPVSSF